MRAAHGTPSFAKVRFAGAGRPFWAPLLGVLLALAPVVILVPTRARPVMNLDLRPVTGPLSPGKSLFLIQLGADGAIFVGADRIELGDLDAVLRRDFQPARQRLAIKADERVTYDDLLTVMGALKAGGYDGFSLVRPDRL